MKPQILMSVFAIFCTALYADSFFERLFEKKDGSIKVAQHIKDRLYIKECGSCHFAYQPEFLPSRSWKKIVSNLEDHFGTDASLESEDLESIEEFLITNAGDKTELKAKKFALSSDRGDIPVRITDLPYFKKEHKEIDKNAVKNEKIKSFANCSACHTDAAPGLYEEKAIVIPGYGRWED